MYFHHPIREQNAAPGNHFFRFYFHCLRESKLCVVCRILYHTCRSPVVDRGNPFYSLMPDGRLLDTCETGVGLWSISRDITATSLPTVSCESDVGAKQISWRGDAQFWLAPPETGTTYICIAPRSFREYAGESARSSSGRS